MEECKPGTSGQEKVVKRTIGRRTVSEISPLSVYSLRDYQTRRSSYGSFLQNLGFLKNPLGFGSQV